MHLAIPNSLIQRVIRRISSYALTLLKEGGYGRITSHGNMRGVPLPLEPASDRFRGRLTSIPDNRRQMSGSIRSACSVHSS